MDASTYRFNQMRHARFAFLISLASIFSAIFMTGLTCYFIAPLGIIIALLTKGDDPALSRQAKYAIYVSTAALIANTILLAFTFYQFYGMLSDPVQRELLSDTLYQQYGITLDDFLQRAGNLIR